MDGVYGSDRRGNARGGVERSRPSRRPARRGGEVARCGRAGRALHQRTPPPPPRWGMALDPRSGRANSRRERRNRRILWDEFGHHGSEGGRGRLGRANAVSARLRNSLPQFIWTCQADGDCDYISPQWVRYTGRREAEQLGYGWLQQVHPEDRQRVIDAWRATAAGGLQFDTEFRIRRHDGAYRWFRTLAVPMRGATRTRSGIRSTSSSPSTT